MLMDVQLLAMQRLLSSLDLQLLVMLPMPFVGVYTRDIAETKAERATDLGKEHGFPLMFTTEPEE